MSVSRREFLATSALAAAATRFPRAAHAQSRAGGSSAKKVYGSGYFGEWIEDEFGLPAFRYTCDQINDPKAKTEVNPGILSSTEHIHQVGNDRICGHCVELRACSGAPG